MILRGENDKYFIKAASSIGRDLCAARRFPWSDDPNISSDIVYVSVCLFDIESDCLSELFKRAAVSMDVLIETG